MASKRNRQRKMERERQERRLARFAERTRRRRQIQAGVAAGVAAVLIILGSIWLLGGFDPDPAKPAERVARGSCTWNLKDPSTDFNVVDVGNPPTSGERRTGTDKLTIKTNLGTLEATVDLAKAPCTAVSFDWLGSKKFYEGSRCHRLDTHSRFLQCGDPNGDGSGSPSYSFADEALPSTPVSTPAPAASPSAGASASPQPGVTSWYGKGTIVMANTGANTNGGQFYIVYDDGSDLPPSYSVVGKIVKGMDIIDRVAKAGAVDDTGAVSPAGRPKTDLIIQQVYVGAPPVATTAPATTTPSAPATPKATATPSTNPSS